MSAYLQFKGITKLFPGVKALNRVSFAAEAGSVHGLLGENGAGKSTLLKARAAVEFVRTRLQAMGVSLNPTVRLARLSVAQRQMVEICKALLRDAKIIALDEPTSSLSHRETQILFRLVKDLQAQGKVLIYVSHRLEEILSCATPAPFSGADKARGGELRLDGKPLRIRRPSDAIRNGIVLCPEDRKEEGIVPIRSVSENINISCRRGYLRWGIFVNDKREAQTADTFIKKLRIKTPGRRQLIRFLSGGNQQKTILGRWLAEPALKVVIMDEPTRGIDVGAKNEIYQILLILNATDNVVISVAVSILAGTLIGFINGSIIAYLRINALITTLATMEIVRGLAFISSGGQAVGVSNEAFIYLAGVILAARITSGQPNAAQGFELNVISACVLGGVSLMGGRATISGVAIGVLIMGTAENVRDLLNVSAFYQYLVRGAILLIAVLVDQLRNRAARD